MPKSNPNVRDLVFDEVSRFSKTPVRFPKETHELKKDLGLVRPAIIHLAAVLREHIRYRRPSATLLTSELEKTKFTIADTVKLVLGRMGDGATPWNTPGIGLVLAFLLLLPGAVSAQSATTPTPRQWVWWTDQLDVRKSFDGGKNEQEPATIAFVNPSNGPDFWLVDLAVKHKGLDIAPPTRPVGVEEFFLSPSVEWHKTSAEPVSQVAATNKVSGNLTSEIYFRDLFSSRSKGTTPPIVLAPWAFLKGTATRNQIRDTNEGSGSFLGSMFSEIDWMPGALSRLGERPFARYVPYFGVEYFNNLAIVPNGATVADAYTGWFTTTRLYIELFPTLNPLVNHNRLVFTGEYVTRSPIGSATLLDRSSLTSASLTFYFDEAQSVGLSYSYEFGENPKANFVTQRRSLIAFRAKL